MTRVASGPSGNAVALLGNLLPNLSTPSDGDVIQFSGGVLVLGAPAPGTLADVLAAGNITGGTDIALTSGDQITGGSANFGTATAAVADGDIASSDSTRNLFYDASTGALTQSGINAALTAHSIQGSANGSLISLVNNTNAGASALSEFRVQGDTAIGQFVVRSSTSAAPNEVLFSAGNGPATFGTSTSDNASIRTNGVYRWVVHASGGHMLAFLDDTYDIGSADGGTTLLRPRDLFLSRNVGMGIGNPGVAAATSGLGVLHLGNAATPPSGALTGGGALLYSSAGEMHVVDAAGNDLIISDAASTGRLVQIVTATRTTVFTTVATTPSDDTIPQITEGAEFLTVTITPTSTSNTLYIFVQLGRVDGATAAEVKTLHLHRDAVANALAAVQSSNNAGFSLQHSLTAPSTSAQTYRLRIGGSSFGTDVNGNGSGTRVLGGACVTKITIMEIIP